MSVASQTSRLEGSALGAWRSYLQSHAIIVRELDAELVAEHGLTGRDYEVLLYLAQAENRKLPMSAISERTMLTRSGITRLIDGLVEQRLIDRVSCESDARVSYAQLTDSGYEKLREAGSTHVRGIERLFLTHFSADELERSPACSAAFRERSRVALHRRRDRRHRLHGRRRADRRRLRRRLTDGS